jgi:biofilm PGA synthesis N-glycosyltransferase PgaC
MSVLERVQQDKESGLNAILVIDSLQANTRACGGIRITPDISIEETRLIARSMSEKYALFGFSKSGGAKASIAIPDDATPEQKKRILQAFALKNKDLLRSRALIPWMDMGTSHEDIRTVLDAAGMPHYPLENCGATTAWSVFGSILGVADALKVKMSESTAALEGFGNVGGALAEELAHAGTKIIAISTSHGAIYDPKGLPVDELLVLRSKHGPAFVKHTRFKTISHKELLELPVTFLIPGARPHSITAELNVHAQAIVPAANVPYADDAAEAQAKRGVRCFPAELCYSGGHIGSRFIRYGFSEEESRAMSFALWRPILRTLAEHSARVNVSPQTFVRHLIDILMLGLQRASFTSRAFEHALRSTKVPKLLRRAGGRWYARHRFNALYKRMNAAASFFATSQGTTGKYAIITPVRDEAKYLAHTISAVASQTVLPQRWIIVDDGSTDETPRILQEAAAKYPWIEVVTRNNRGKRAVGKGVAEAFNEGFARLSGVDFEYIAKLDADITLPPRYFAAMIEQFKTDKQLGIASGTFSMLVKGRLLKERLHAWTTAAHARVYRKECFEDIGGLPQCLGWDTIDEQKALLRGWRVQSFDAARGIHLRPIASTTGAWWNGREREGKAAYFCGAHPLFALARGIRLTARPPYVLGGLFYLKGYVAQWLRRAPQYAEKDVTSAVRTSQLRRLALR